MITFIMGGEKHVLPIDSSKTLRVGSVSPSVTLEVEEMTETEKKALALLNDACRGRTTISYEADTSREDCVEMEALCRAIEQHETDIADLQAEYDEVCKLFEAFRQEVSDAVTGFDKYGTEAAWEKLSRFIIAKPDPLVEAMQDATVAAADALGLKLGAYTVEQEAADQLRAAIEARGGRIVWEGE